ATHYVDRTSGCSYETGERNCIALDGPFHTIGRAVRQFGAMLPGDTLQIRGGSYPEPIVLNKPTQIHVYDGPVTIGPNSLLPFDLVADRLDDNGLPLNPRWGAQIPNLDTLPDPSQCPGLSSGSSGACSHQYTDTDRGYFGCGPHVNWFGATYEGTIAWES